jgi:hypothetical protein
MHFRNDASRRGNIPEVHALQGIAFIRGLLRRPLCCFWATSGIFGPAGWREARRIQDYVTLCTATACVG